MDKNTLTIFTTKDKRFRVEENRVLCTCFVWYYSEKIVYSGDTVECFKWLHEHGYMSQNEYLAEISVFQTNE